MKTDLTAQSLAQSTSGTALSTLSASAATTTDNKMSSIDTIATQINKIQQKSNRALHNLKYNPRKRNICLAVTGLCVAVGAVATRYLMKCQCIHPSDLWNHNFTPLFTSAVQFGTHFWEMARNVTFGNR